MATDSWYDVNKTFLSGIVARDIAEPLPSFDATTPASNVREVMQERGYTVAGVRRYGFVSHYVALERLGDGACGDYAAVIFKEDVLPDDAPIIAVIRALNARPLVFVRMLGSVGGMVRKIDMEDPPVRMWLFGLLTSLEQRFTAMIEARYADESWTRYLSSSRVENARELKAMRAEGPRPISLLQCLMFGDKARIVARDDVLREQVGLPNRERADEVMRLLHRLRNDLAHAHGIVASDWEIIVGLAENLDSVVARGLV